MSQRPRPLAGRVLELELRAKQDPVAAGRKEDIDE